ncbi:MAG: lamin tail domain-containing protein [Candidatus Woesearchaeota archaeon]
MRYILLILLSTTIAIAHPQITAILYDPPGPDAGFEWIEFYNPTNQTIHLQDYQLYKSNGRTDWERLELHGTIPQNRYFLVAEHDTPADFQTYLRLVNVRGAIQLRYNQTILETIGWADLDNQTFFQEQPAAPARDRPLVRISNSTNNQEAFEPQLHYEPKTTHYDPHLQVDPTQANITYALTIENYPVQLHGYRILTPDRSPKPGHHISGMDTYLEIQPNITDPNGLDTVSIVYRIHNQENTIAYNQTIKIPVPSYAGEYTIEWYATDGETKTQTQYIDIIRMESLGLQVKSQFYFEKINQTHFGQNITITNTGSVNQVYEYTVYSPQITFESVQIIPEYEHHKPATSMNLQIIVKPKQGVSHGTYMGNLHIIALQS